jgi:hypothetical protein
MEATFKPDYLDKRILVHFKYYPDMDSVPERISDSKMGQARQIATGTDTIQLGNLLTIS